MIHSKYNPVTEAARMIQAQLRGYDLLDKVILYGFGCGHHIRELRRIIGHDVEIEVWETNVAFFYEVLKHDDFTDIFKDRRLKLKITKQTNLFILGSLDLNVDEVAVFIHQPSLRLVPKSLYSFRLVMEKFLMRMTTTNNFSSVMKENFLSNVSLRHPSITPFVQQFERIPIIMVSAGSSLEKNVHLLNSAKKHSFVCCVGTALKPLLNQGIYPDFFMMIDPKDSVLEQIADVCDLDIPLFYLSTVNKNVPCEYKGPKFIVYQEGYPLAEEYAIREGVPATRSGGSVATSLFDLLLRFGFHPICLVGQDLAYTNRKTHVTGAHNFRYIDGFNNDIIYTLSFDQSGKVPTSRQLLLYRDWFVNITCLERRSLYNATEGGVYIDGFEHITLAEFIDKNKKFDISVVRETFKKSTKLLARFGFNC